jgi:hypothetical protein
MHVAILHILLVQNLGYMLEVRRMLVEVAVHDGRARLLVLAEVERKDSVHHRARNTMETAHGPGSDVRFSG